MSHIAAAAGPVQDVLHPRVTRRELPDGRIVYAKRAWTGADGEALLRREADLQRVASALPGPYGVLAVPPALVEGDRPELRSDAILDEVPFGDEAGRNEVTAEVLAAGFRIGRQLRALHGSAAVPERATPETPVLIPVRIERLFAVPDSTIALLASLPSWVSRRAGAWAGKKVLGAGFIHGDFKPDNVFVSADSVTFIDWERAGSGEKAHDLASFIAGTLSLRLGSIGTAGTGDRGRAREALTRASAGAWDLAAAFLAGYADDRISGERMEALVGMTGVKLLARTQTIAHVGAPDSPLVRACTALLLRMIDDPRPAASVLRKAMKEYSGARG